VLLDDFARALDPVSFAIDCGIAPDDWQADLLVGGAQKSLLLCSRQAGKSTATALLALHEAIYQPPALILLISPSLRQSGELFKKVMEFWHGLKGAPESAYESALRLELRNGSRIIALPGSEATVRGFSAARLVVVDEAARVPDELLAAVRPTLATTNGRFIALSTPAGRRGWFFEQWQHGSDWQRIKITADECPRISREFLENEERELGPLLYRQEYMCEFVDDQTTVFSSELIEAAISDEVEPLWAL